ncbi:MAG: hypothetical protein P8Z72_12215 [Gammaproteobacteria bacterium]
MAACLVSLSACGGGSAGVGGNNQAPDPTVTELPIAYVKRTTPVDMNGMPVSGDISDPEAMQAGAHLIVKKTASVSSPEIDVTQAIIGNDGDVRDLSFSNDGTKLLFALHKPMVNNANPPITWNIYEYDLTKPLSQAAGSENPKLVMPFNNSDGDDIEPHFIPGNRIIFSSDRATDVTGAIELNEGFFSIFQPTVEDAKSNKHSFHLFSMAIDGTDLHQLTFNMSDDLYPTVIRNIPGLEGRVMFSRWEHSPGKNQMTLYTMKPDGSDVQMLYGEYSHNTGSNPSGSSNNAPIHFTQPQETSAGKVMALAMPFTNTFDGGDPVLLDVQHYTDINQPLNPTSGLTGPGQISLSNNTVNTKPGISLGGRFSSIFPLLDGSNRALVSYSLCFVTVSVNGTNETKGCNDPSVDLSTATEAPPRYGIFIYDIGSQTMLPITPPQAGIYFTDVVAAENLTDAPYIPYNIGSGATGIINIRSVYDMDGSFNPMGSSATSLSQLTDPAQSTADQDNTGLIQRPAMFLRIVKGTYMPDKDTYDFKSSAFGVSKARLMRQIIGYAPIYPDGSVRVKVPANVPLSFSIVDKNGRRVRTLDNNNRPINYRHGTWLSVRPGKTLSCGGCHSPYSTAPHGRLGGQANNLYPGATQAEVDAGAFTHTRIAPTAIGETMAEAWTNASINTLTPSVDINFTDAWTDMTTAANTNRTQLDPPFFYDYSWLPDQVAPVASSCMSPTGSWNVTCRISIDYKTDIDPMWSYARVVTDALGNPVTVNNATVDATCTSCHSYQNPDPNNPGVPAGQLDLSDNVLSQTTTDWLSSYSQLLLNHNKVDANGTAVLDANGNTITIDRTMMPGTANGSSFFSVFAVNADGTCPPPTTSIPTPHCTAGQPWLTVHELKLLSEWVDTGAQYFNNPFAAPKN